MQANAAPGNCRVAASSPTTAAPGGGTPWPHVDALDLHISAILRFNIISHSACRVAKHSMHAWARCMLPCQFGPASQLLAESHSPAWRRVAAVYVLLRNAHLQGSHEGGGTAKRVFSFFTAKRVQRHIARSRRQPAIHAKHRAGQSMSTPACLRQLPPQDACLQEACSMLRTGPWSPGCLSEKTSMTMRPPAGARVSRRARHAPSAMQAAGRQAAGEIARCRQAAASAATLSGMPVKQTGKGAGRNESGRKVPPARLDSARLLGRTC